MATKRILITIGDKSVEVVLRSATVLDGLFRGSLVAQSFDHEEQSKDVRIAGALLYPNCVACVESPESVRSMPLAEFIKMSEQDIDAWLKAAYELNPHWLLKKPEAGEKLSEEAEKKITTRFNGSKKSITARKPKPAISPH
jgi:hypothetical protein